MGRGPRWAAQDLAPGTRNGFRRLSTHHWPPFKRRSSCPLPHPLAMANPQVVGPLLGGGLSQAFGWRR